MSKKTVLIIVIVAVAAIAVCIGVSTADSCKRLNRSCFGNSQSK